VGNFSSRSTTATVHILFKGAPAPNLQLETAWTDGHKSETTVAGRTNAEGRVSMKVDRPGKWRLHAIKMERCAELQVADWESYWASLTFEIR
jgi:uncharacterized GH25 family protein